jgi:iron complex transport system substrate-binding protein
VRALIATVVVVLLCSLGALPQGKLVITDQAGRSVEIETPVERVVSLYGVATMYLYALGVQDRLVLGTYVGLRPETPPWEALSAVDPDLPEKYSRAKPSLEEILAREPDLVLASATIDRETADGLSAFGVPVVLLHAEDVQGIKEATEILGKVFGTEERVARLIAYLEESVERIRGLMAEKGLEAPRVLFVGTRPLRVASGDMYQTELIRLAGGIPVAEELRGYWQNVDIEQVLLWDPEVIFIAPYGKVFPEDLFADPVWRAVRAVREGRVYKMPRVFAPWDVPTPESFLGLLWMAAKLHPELGIDVVAEARAFYRDFYGYELSEATLSVIAG